MQKGSSHQTAQGVIGLLIVGIGFVLFYKLFANQSAFDADPSAMFNYVIMSIVAMALLTGLFFLVSKKPHTKTAKVAKSSVKSAKKKKK
ncbi:MAG TPA: hypothetical protein VF810_05320 [Patescibacteria group bacterium]